jgi:phosphoribosylaminoimidazolecarboxamide formyltransferase/IMP cyclohydrolase
VSQFKQIYRTIMDDHFPQELSITFGDQKLVYRKRTWKLPDEKTGEIIEKGLRYGENPGQEAALYELVGGNVTLGDCRFIEPGLGIVSAIDENAMIQAGKHPGKINLTDLDNALNILKFLTRRPAVAIMKHNNPCGVAYGANASEAYDRANMADRIAAFGGCAVFNRPVDRPAAEMVAQNYLEVLAAPDFEESTIEILKKRKNLRIVRVGRMDRLEEYAKKRFIDIKSLIDGGLIVQQSPICRVMSREDFQPAVAVHKDREVRIRRMPTEREYEDMLFGWHVEQGVTSNSVIYVKDGCTVGIGTGEQDRVGVAEIAIFKAYTKYADALCFRAHGLGYKELEIEISRGRRSRELQEEIDEQTRNDRAGLPGSTMISDAFFPFRDGVDVAIRQGITGIVQPGGSDRDYESIQACNETDPPVAMVFTGERAFKH